MTLIGRIKTKTQEHTDTQGYVKCHNLWDEDFYLFIKYLGFHDLTES
jgi:hypothetical protein